MLILMASCTNSTSNAIGVKYQGIWHFEKSFSLCGEMDSLQQVLDYMHLDSMEISIKKDDLIIRTSKFNQTSYKCSIDCDSVKFSANSINNVLYLQERKLILISGCNVYTFEKLNKLNKL